VQLDGYLDFSCSLVITMYGVRSSERAASQRVERLFGVVALLANQRAVE
jgi:hypothetical protein